jgi:uncharacterized damage-inducible protein DinB
MIDRPIPPVNADERTMLRIFLDYHRATLAMKCHGLLADQPRQRAVPTSGLSLLGLVRHMAEVERTWFRRVINGEEVPLVWSPVGDYQAAYNPSGSSMPEAFAAWTTEIEHSRRIEAAAESLDITGYQASWEEDVSLRLVMLHLIHEYARHNGHADLLREAIDGVVGV